jgi:hypothetical protein
MLPCSAHDGTIPLDQVEDAANMREEQHAADTVCCQSPQTYGQKQYHSPFAAAFAAAFVAAFAAAATHATCHGRMWPTAAP